MCMCVCVVSVIWCLRARAYVCLYFVRIDARALSLFLSIYSIYIEYKHGVDPVQVVAESFIQLI